ncbi:uncharacterized protein LOC111059971 isoform X3 [Nilaparvata lugens]|uniref:uncharacterized protein LOC111059971 isoform X3 n=1 Tax=Nilaparvata lugens TaxID=108931 RepID=UPI00193CF56D|nr:uncharacterized protein LOC111059971 isoform X3 [Nilaparvata lugens]
MYSSTIEQRFNISTQLYCQMELSALDSEKSDILIAQQAGQSNLLKKKINSDDGSLYEFGSVKDLVVSGFSSSIESIPNGKCKKSENYEELNSKGSLLTRVKVKYHEKRGETGGLIHGMLRLRNSDTDFKYESQEVWECKEMEKEQKKKNKSSNKKTEKDNAGNGENNDQSSGFLRVVNKLKILTPEVRYMETFDGVSIIKDETDLRVIEIKYLDLNNPDEVVKYGGKLVFDDKDKENVKSTYSKGIKSIQKTIDDTAAFIGGNSYSPRSLQMRDYDPLNLVPTGGGQTKSEKTINFKPSTDGIQITMDITPTLTELITFNEVIECEFLANEKMHPVVKISIKKSRASETREEQIGMKENYKQSKYFKWVVREVWQCKIPNQVEPIRRIVTEQHLIKDANKFIYDPILSKVWVELVAEKTILKIKDVRYWNPSNQHTIYLNASISLAEREVKLKSEFWMSGNMPFNGLENLGGGNAVLQDIWLGLTLTEQEGKDKKTVSRNGPEYKYPLKRISYPDSIRTVTFEKGSRVFQIGSKASSEIPASTQIWCDIENSRDSKSLLDYVPRVIEYIDGEMFLLDIDLLKDAFTIMKKEVWTCSNGQKSITRIDTIMCAQDPIHAVRSLGGVEVDSFVFIEQVSSAAVTETIYILDGKIVKYGGTPSSKSPPSKDDAVSLCSTQPAYIDFPPDEQPPPKGVSSYLKKVGNCISEKISDWLISYSSKRNLRKMKRFQKEAAAKSRQSVAKSSASKSTVNN